MKNICIITSKYPNKNDPAALVFVQQLVWAIADLGVDCTVICPVAMNIELSKGIRLPYKQVEKTKNGAAIKIYRPKYFGFGQQDLKFINTAKLTLETFTKAVTRVIKSFKNKPDIIYGHFISPSGVVAARMGRRFDIPSFLAYGESSQWGINNLGLKKVIRELYSLSGVVAVSTDNKNELIRSGIIDKRKIEVFPNSINPNRFYPRNRKDSRDEFALPHDKFIVAFVGHFIKRKGIDKVMEALNQLDEVYGIYAGKGPIHPNSEKTLHGGLVSPDELPYFLSAADAFVLPTLREGCCNAIIEAMACGLPIISSNLPFNDDILDETCSIRINPLNIDEIKSAIKTLYDDRERLKALQKGSLEKVKSLSLDARAKGIIGFIEGKLHNK